MGKFSVERPGTANKIGEERLKTHTDKERNGTRSRSTSRE